MTRWIFPTDHDTVKPLRLLHFHRHGQVEPQVLTDLAADSGFRVVDSGPAGKRSLQYVLAEKSG